MHYDAIIIGARCAGAATAMQLARGGKRVLVLDRHPAGIDTMSTHALMRGAVIQLNRWGLLGRVIASGAPEVTRTRFSYGDETIDLAIKPTHGTRALVAPRRCVLDRILADAAQKAGAELRFGASFVDVLRDAEGQIEGVCFDGQDCRETAAAPLVIGADGRRSTVARRVNAPVLRHAEHVTNCIYAYVTGLPDEGCQWFYQKGISAGAIPTHDNAHCVCASTTPKRFRNLVHTHGREGALLRLVAETNAAFGDRFAMSKPLARPIVYGGDRSFLRQATGSGWALVGDAGYFKDPLTAHGITDAFRDAETLTQTILSGALLANYEAKRNAASAEMFDVTDRIAALDWTFDELKALHLRLNQIMNAEQVAMSGDGNLAQAA